jgi:hypothetical protein
VARRFVTFLDIAYEHRTQLVVATTTTSSDQGRHRADTSGDEELRQDMPRGTITDDNVHQQQHPAEGLVLPLLQEAARQVGMSWYTMSVSMQVISWYTMSISMQVIS